MVGVGQLGMGIAASLVSHGYSTVIFDVRPEAHERARNYVGHALQELVARAGFPANILDGWGDRLVNAGELEEFGGCRFVIESVVEDLAAKTAVFERLEEVVGVDVPIASNTSALPISELQRSRKRPGRFLGMHWNDPAYATRFLELIRGEMTSDAALRVAAELALVLGKEPAFVQKDVPGFVANRMAYAMYREAVHLLETGVADVETIDRAFQHSVGFWASFCGPLRWIDITGGPWLYAKAMQGVLPTLNNSSELPETFEQGLRTEERGVKNGRGFYDYEPGDSERWEKLLREHAWRTRVTGKDGLPES